MLKRFISYYRPHWPLLALDMTTAVTRSVFAILIPWLSRDILGRWAPAGDLVMVGWYTLATLALAAGMCWTTYINTFWGHVLGTRMETDMRGDLFHHLQKLSFSYFDNTKTGHIMSRISNDLFTISEIAHHGPEDLFISVITLVGAAGFMLYMDPLLTLFALAPIPLMLAWGGFFGVRMRHSFREVRRTVADINSNVENAIQGIREVKSYANEPHQRAQFGEVNDRFKQAKEGMYRKMAGFHSGMGFFTEAYRIVVVAAGAVRLSTGSVTLADIVAFLMYVGFILDPIRRIVHFIETYQQGIASFERFIEIMDVEPEIQDRPQARTLEKLVGRLEFRGVWFRYTEPDAPTGASAPGAQAPEPAWVLCDINLCVPAGRTIALVGESGAGKSSLVSLIPRFYAAQRGTITLDDVNVMDLQERFIRESIGIVQQTPFMFDATIRENIAFGRPTATDAEIEEAARQANILAFIQSLPDQFESRVGEQGVKLSGGQKQRISIARVFLKNPPVLIFDEATSSLDTESEQLIQTAMQRLCRGRTTLIIAHRLSTVRQADYTYVLQQGRLVEAGTHDELLAAGGVYTRLHLAGDHEPI
jgi:ATP-binding cassette, subfamily B, bacterial